MIHMAPRTTSSIVSKSIARGGGRAAYRGEVRVDAGAHHAANTVRCDALLVDTISRSDTYPAIDIRQDDVQLGHEATVSRVSEEQLFYLQSRGIHEDEARRLVVHGFFADIIRKIGVPQIEARLLATVEAELAKNVIKTVAAEVSG